MKPHPVVLVYFAERLSSRMRITATDALDETECVGGISEPSSIPRRTCDSVSYTPIRTVLLTVALVVTSINPMVDPFHSSTQD